jgi:hypothetical protein
MGGIAAKAIARAIKQLIHLRRPLRVISGKARSEHIPSGLLPKADIVDAFQHFRLVPIVLQKGVEGR